MTGTSTPASYSSSSSSSTLVPDDYQIDPNNYWVYGYGSLIYKPPPYTELRVPGYITGYVRRFWQSSNDHRGTPQAPGRVVTLIEHEFWEELTRPSSTLTSQTTNTNPIDPHPAPLSGKTWGVAYKILPQHAQYVKEYLDYREKNGYTEHRVPFTVHSQYRIDFNNNSKNKGNYGNVTLPESLTCHVYIGTPDNFAFAGPQDPEYLARHIINSRGPSGENREYLYKLQSSLKDLARLPKEDAGKEINEGIVIVASESDDEYKYEWEDDDHISDLVTRAKLYETTLNTN